MFHPRRVFEFYMLDNRIIDKIKTAVLSGVFDLLKKSILSRKQNQFKDFSQDKKLSKKLGGMMLSQYFWKKNGSRVDLHSKIIVVFWPS